MHDGLKPGGEEKWTEALQKNNRKGENTMEAAEVSCNEGIDLETECYELILDELRAQEALPASDQEIRLWSFRAYYVTAARCLHAGLGRARARETALSVALSIAACLAHKVTVDDGAKKNLQSV